MGKKIERNNEIYVLKCKGWTVREIGEHFGISFQRVTEILQDDFRNVYPRLYEIKKRKLLEYLKGYKSTHDGNTPTVRQMIDGANMSTANRVYRCLLALENDGKISLGGPDRKQLHISIVGGRWYYEGE